MSESLVDLSYRGLNLGKRIKLTQVRPTTGYLEMPTPMPVGTAIGIATDDGVLLEAIVTEILEQVTGETRTPGMLVKPKLDADAARTWWKQRVALPEIDKLAPAADAGGKVTLVTRREEAQLVDDGRSTAVMEAYDDGSSPQQSRTTTPGGGVNDSARPATILGQGMAALAADHVRSKRETDPTDMPRDPNQVLIDDGKRTMAMSAIDLEALGLDPASSSGSMRASGESAELPAIDSGPVAAGEDDGDATPDDKSNKPKKKRRRR